MKQPGLTNNQLVGLFCEDFFVMTELIPLKNQELNGEPVNTVDARELHNFLGVKSDFRNWIKNRINDFGFVENQDFLSFGKNLPKPNGGRPSTEYYLSIGMAKELCMVERTEKGKEARLYFIECEKIAKEKKSLSLPNFTNPAEAARAWAVEFEQRQAAEQKANILALEAKVNAPKVAYVDQITASSEHLTITEAAKLIGFPPRSLKDYMRQIGWLYATKDTPKQSEILNGRLVLRTGHFTHKDGTHDTRAYPHVTHKGMFDLYKRLLWENRVTRNEKLELAFA